MATASGCKAMLSAGTAMRDVAAVILAGGKSSRMRRDKAILPYQGKRLVDVVAEAVRAAGIDAIFISGQLEGYNSIPDLMLERGPVGGICSSIARFGWSYSRVLFIPVDMPHLTPQLINALLSQPEDKAYHFEHHPLPCILPMNRYMLNYVDATAQTLAKKKKVAVRDFLAGLHALSIPASEALEYALTNTNTPKEWLEATHESAY